jgi:methylase of polypeptide subunit release factors
MMNVRTRIIHNLNVKLNHTDYSTEFFSDLGLSNLFVGEGTLGPEMSWVAHLLTHFLLTHPYLYSDKEVLDMGCGSGVQTVATALKGAKSVIGADISKAAIRSTAENITRFNLQNATCVESDLFDNLNKEKTFDVIIFNYPFISGTPSDEKEGIYIAETETINRFFKEARKHLTHNGILIMPFSHLGDHDPSRYALMHGYYMLNEIKLKNNFGAHSIFLFRAR